MREQSPDLAIEDADELPAPGHRDAEQLLGCAVQKADVRVDALDDFTVELQYEAQYAVSRRMLGPKIEGEVAQGCFGHNGLASAAGSTLAADAGSRSIGFQFHRADVIDAARTGSASGTSMLLSLLESREYVTE